MRAEAGDLRRRHRWDLGLVRVDRGHPRGYRALAARPPVRLHERPAGVVPRRRPDVLSADADPFGEPEPQLGVVRRSVLLVPEVLQQGLPDVGPVAP
jgi:hypothetical protein